MRILVLCAVLFLACCQDGSEKADRNDSKNFAEKIAIKQNSFEDNAKATVSVSSEFVLASGVFLNNRGDILTSLHLVPEGADPMFVKWEISDGFMCFGAESLYWDRQLDILILRSGVQSEHYLRFSDVQESPEYSGVYLIGRQGANGILMFEGKYLGDQLPYGNFWWKISNYLLSLRRFSSGGGIFRSGNNSLIGINRLTVNESQTPVPISGATIGDIKIFLRCHRIDFEEAE